MLRLKLHIILHMISLSLKLNRSIRASPLFEPLLKSTTGFLFGGVITQGRIFHSLFYEPNKWLRLSPLFCFLQVVPWNYDLKIWTLTPIVMHDFNTEDILKMVRKNGTQIFWATSHMYLAWRIIPVSKRSLTMVSKSPKSVQVYKCKNPKKTINQFDLRVKDLTPRTESMKTCSDERKTKNHPHPWSVAF